MPLREIRIQETTPVPAAVLVFLHGYGATEQDLLPLAQLAPASCRKVLVRAPIVAQWGGSAWFQIGFTPAGIAFEESEARKSLALLVEHIQKMRGESPGVPFYLIGFSQGAGMSLAAALSSPGLVDGVICFSGLLPEPFSSEVPPARKDVPLALWIGHGIQDDVLPISYARGIRTVLERTGHPFIYREYPARHEISMAMLTDAYRWLERQLRTAEMRVV